MNYSAEQVINGLMNYADAEIMGKLPTTGKWIMGTAITLAQSRVENLIDSLMDNAVINMLGIIDEAGNIDVEELTKAMKTTADKYGKMSFEVPMVGKLTFSSSDIESLKNYIR